MEELEELKQRLGRDRPAPWEALPDIPLYMDQVISYMPRQLIRFDETEPLTSAMVNNYIKDGLLPRAGGKRYERSHLAFLTAICTLKQILSVREIGTLLRNGTEGREREPLYSYFCEKLDSALTETANRLDTDLERDALAGLALDLALRSYASKLACQRILSLLQQDGESEKKHNKKREAT